MKIIFLDIDGVLATSESYKIISEIDGKRYSSFDAKAVNNLNILLARTNANVVISSTWRKFYSIELLSKIFKHEGVDCNIVGRTQSMLTDLDRGAEIKAYLFVNPADKFVIIDDDINDIIEYFPDNTVHVEKGFIHNGLTPQNIKQAGEILSNDK